MRSKWGKRALAELWTFDQQVRQQDGDSGTLANGGQLNSDSSQKLPIFAFYDDCEDSECSQQFASDNDLLRSDEFGSFQESRFFKPTPSRNLIHPAMRKSKLAPAKEVIRSKSFQDQTNSIPQRLKMLQKSRLFLRSKDRPKKLLLSPNGGSSNETRPSSSLAISAVTSESTSATASAVTIPSSTDEESNKIGCSWLDDEGAGSKRKEKQEAGAPLLTAQNPRAINSSNVESAILHLMRSEPGRRVLSHGDVSSFVYIDEDSDVDYCCDGLSKVVEVGPNISCTSLKTSTCSSSMLAPEMLVSGIENREKDDSSSGGAFVALVEIVDGDDTTRSNSNKCSNKPNSAQQQLMLMAAAALGDGEDKENRRRGHLLGRIYRRMRKCSMGWSKTGCRVRRGDCFVFKL